MIIIIGLIIGLDLCEPHQCQCGSAEGARGLHSFVCKRAPGRSAMHHALNDLVARSFPAAGVPVTKELVGMSRTDGTGSRCVGTLQCLLSSPVLMELLVRRVQQRLWPVS